MSFPQIPSVWMAHQATQEDPPGKTRNDLKNGRIGEVPRNLTHKSLCSALHFSAVLPVEGFDTETIVSPVKLVSFRFS